MIKTFEDLLKYIKNFELENQGRFTENNLFSSLKGLKRQFFGTEHKHDEIPIFYLINLGEQNFEIKMLWFDRKTKEVVPRPARMH